MQFWKIGKSEEELSFLFEMCDHESSVNSIRFSPCGRMLASASDRQIIIYSGINLCLYYHSPMIIMISAHF